MMDNQLRTLSGISFAHINIRSLYRKLEDIIRVVTIGEICVLGISKTWLNKSVPDHMINIDNYELFRNDRNSNSGKSTGGGFCLYVHTKYNTTHRDDISVCTPHIETVWIRLSLKDMRPMFIACVYRPPSGTLDCALDVLEEHITLLRSEHTCDILIMGDINVDSLKPWSLDCRKLSDFNKRTLMTPLINEPTYYQGDYRSSIDNILVSNTEYYHIHGTVGTCDTVHLLIYTT